MGTEPDTRGMREEHEAEIRRADTAEEFEQAMNSLLKNLGTSHTSFFHEDEIQPFWRELDSEHHRVATLFRTLLLTAQRSGEASRMRWSQLQPALFERTADGLAFPSKVEAIVWTIPGADAENGLAPEVSLSGAVIDLLRDLATRDEAERLRINSTRRAKRN